MSGFGLLSPPSTKELWAGRYSAAIDDKEFDERVELAKKARNDALEVKQDYLNASPEFNKPHAESNWQREAREYISNESGLDLYPGHLRSDEKNPIFMSEFSDAGSKFRDGAWDELVNQSKEGNLTLLGDLYDHPELYRHYPEVQFLPVYADPEMGEDYLGTYSRPFEEAPLGLMRLNPSRTDMVENRDTLLHELQHFIQSAEGWEGGGMLNSETGVQYVDNLLESGKHHTGEHYSPQAERLSNAVTGMLSKSDEIMPFMKSQDVGGQLAGEAYSSLSGEQLARDATAREAAGIQVENYYNGPTDGYEYGTWNHTDGSLLPMAAMPAIRQEMIDSGLLGPISVDDDGELYVDSKSLVDDPYVEKYLKMLRGE